MSCCSPKTTSPMRLNNRRGDVILRFPGAALHLMGSNEAVELASGDLTILRITEGGMLLATVVKIGADLQWPLTKDEPVIKLDQLHYLFTLPDEEGSFLNYGVSFNRPDSRLASLDLFLKENACFSTPSRATASSSSSPSSEVYWKDYSPRIEEYNGLLAKAIATGTGEIVKGIFKCSSFYCSQVQKGAKLIQPQVFGNKTGISNVRNNGYKSVDANKHQGEINKSLRRVRKLSGMMEKMSWSLLNGVISITGFAAVPLVKSKAGHALLASVPGEVIMASLDAMNMVLDAIEAAERKTIDATSAVVSGAVSKRFGESAGEATQDVFATAGHAVGTAWNIFKVRKALKPSSVSKSMLKTAVNNRH